MRKSSTPHPTQSLDFCCWAKKGKAKQVSTLKRDERQTRGCNEAKRRKRERRELEEGRNRRETEKEGKVTWVKKKERKEKSRRKEEGEEKKRVRTYHVVSLICYSKKYQKSVDSKIEMES